VKVSRGEKVTVELKNEGGTTHTFTSTALHVDKQVGPDKSAKVTFTVPSTGSAFQFHCDFHESMGMKGAIYTKAGGKAS
jgi:plastocyanin